MNQQITIKTPGKLMVAGEYAVLEPNQKLIVMAVDRFVHTSISPSTANEIHPTDFFPGAVKWEWQDDKVKFAVQDDRLNFIKSAMETTYRYLLENQIPISPVKLSITSELADRSGIKYGLGSSAAVVTSVVKALLSFFLREKPSDLVIFKIASIAHVQTQGNGSGADIAASTFGGVLEFTSPQAEWLLEEIASIETVTALVRKDWIYFSAYSIQLPSSLRLMVAWTGKAASTEKLVNQIRVLKKTDARSYRDFLEKSALALELILQGVRNDNAPIFLKGITENRLALAELGNAAHVEIETDTLRQLSIIAEQMGGAGKLSGAGGGDCGIAFIPKDVSFVRIRGKWSEQNIQALDLHIYVPEHLE